MDIIKFFGNQGFVLLTLSAALIAASHSFFLMKMPKVDISLRIIAYLLIPFIFVLSGFKAGIVAIPLIIFASFVGGYFAKIIIKECRE